MAPLIIATKETMICLGGFMGADPWSTVTSLPGWSRRAKSVSSCWEGLVVGGPPGRPQRPGRTKTAPAARRTPAEGRPAGQRRGDCLGPRAWQGR